MIPRTVEKIMCSRDGKREYRIMVAKPAAEPPPSGYPVVYLLDANSVFGTMEETVRVQGSRPEKTGVVPAVIVGIGYPTEAPFASARYYDFTMPSAVTEAPARPNGAAWPEQGGAESFLAFIEETVKPEIEREYTIDRGRQTIFGHSLGGLFVLQVLFTQPGLFQTYIAGSPSIHWNKRNLLEAERNFTARSDVDFGKIGLMVAIGELEKSHKSGIYDNAKELAERLSGLADRGLRLQFKSFEGEGHVSVLPALVSRAARFALSM
jgi:predicted alpha/beta superfamily hydrolase